MSTNIQQLPNRHAIEPRHLSEEMRVSQEPSGRFYKGFMRNMQGMFLTLLDEEGRILYFVAGALRRCGDEECDELTTMYPKDILAGMIGAYQPEYNVEQIRGEDRRGERRVIFEEVPFLSLNLGCRIPEAVSYGLLQVNPNPNRRWSAAGIPNGVNSEIHLSHRTWNEEVQMGHLAAAGGNDIASRLAPRALEIASTVQSAWSLAMTGSFLFGGMTENLPSVEPIRPSTVLNKMIDHETMVRRQKKEEAASRRALRVQAERLANNPDQRRHDEGLRALATAINPSSLEELENKLKE